MEAFVKILESYPVKEREYTRKNGEKQTFVSRGFYLSSGNDSFYAEMTGEMAKTFEDIDLKAIYSCRLSFWTRNYMTNQGEEAHTTDIYIDKMQKW